MIEKLYKKAYVFFSNLVNRPLNPCPAELRFSIKTKIYPSIPLIEKEILQVNRIKVGEECRTNKTCHRHVMMGLACNTCVESYLTMLDRLFFTIF